MPAVDPVILEIRADADQGTRAVRRYADDVETSMTRAGTAVDRSSRALTVAGGDSQRSLNAIRFAGIGAGQQLQDMAVQFQAGAHASTIFAQQVPQLAFALSGLEGNANRTADRIGKFATFLSGPWGLAINLAVIAGGALISNMTSMGNSAANAAPKVDTLTEAIKRLNDAQEDIGAVGTVEARIAKLQSDRLKLENDMNLVDADVAAMYAKRVRAIDAEITGLQQVVKWNAVTVQGEKDKAAYKEKQREAEQAAEAAARKTAAAAKAAQAEIDRQNEGLNERVTSLQQQIVLQRMIDGGQEQIAARLAARWELERQFPKASKDQLSAAIELSNVLLDQKFLTERIAEAHANIVKAMKDAAIAAPDKTAMDALGKSIADAANIITAEAIPSTKELEDALARVRDRGIDSVADGFTDAIMGAEDLSDAFSRVADQIIADLIRIAIKRSIVEPLGNFLFPAGGGGIFGALFGLGGHAGGGYAAPGSISRVNEQNGGVELLRLGSQGGTVIPLGQASQSLTPAGAPSGGLTTVRLELSGDIEATIDQRSTTVAVEVVRAAGPTIANAGASEAVRRLTRPRL